MRNLKLANATTTIKSTNSDCELNLIQPNFLDYFKDIKDPRIERKKLYPIEEILLITICAFICEAEG